MVKKIGYLPDNKGGIKVRFQRNVTRNGVGGKVTKFMAEKDREGIHFCRDGQESFFTLLRRQKH